MAENQDEFILNVTSGTDTNLQVLLNKFKEYDKTLESVKNGSDDNIVGLADIKKRVETLEENLSAVKYVYNVGNKEFGFIANFDNSLEDFVIKLYSFYGKGLLFISITEDISSGIINLVVNSDTIVDLTGAFIRVEMTDNPRKMDNSAPIKLNIQTRDNKTYICSYFNDTTTE